MTLLLVWERRIGGLTELVFASDSRLRSGQAWDCGPKIFPMSRGDCAFGFVGATAYAYPMILQAARSIEYHPSSKSRALDLYELKGHLRRVLNHMLEQIHDFPVGESEPEPIQTEFVFGGYSWRRQETCIWKFIFSPSEKRLGIAKVGGWDGAGVQTVLPFWVTPRCPLPVENGSSRAG